jgi:hypothetical protein
MLTITPELRQAVEKAGDQPVRLEDPDNRCAYVLLKEAAYERLRSSGDEPEAPLFDIPEGVRRSQRAFLRDLPELLKDEALRGQWVAYHGDERVGIAPSDEPLIRECMRRGLRKDRDYDLFIINETEEVEMPSSWYS